MYMDICTVYICWCTQIKAIHILCTLDRCLHWCTLTYTIVDILLHVNVHNNECICLRVHENLKSLFFRIVVQSCTFYFWIPLNCTRHPCYKPLSYLWKDSTVIMHLKLQIKYRPSKIVHTTAKFFAGLTFL